MELPMKEIIRIVLCTLLFFPLNIYAAEFKKNDEGTTTVNQVIENTQKSEVPLYSEAETSEDLAANFLDEAGLTEGDNNGLFVAVGTAVLPEPDPASNPDFITMRRIKVSEASLDAKRQFIEFIRITMSAEDVVTLPESPFQQNLMIKCKLLEIKLIKPLEIIK